MPSHPDIELVATCWTTAGNAVPLAVDESSPHDLLERIDAAAAAGYRGFGILHADLLVARERHGYDRIRKALDDAGMKHVEVEILANWFIDDDRRAASDVVRRDLLEAAEALDARHIKVGGDFERFEWPVELVAQDFHALCVQAEAAGTRIALEPMPFSSVPDLHAGLQIIRRAGHPAGGLLLDIWHVAKTGPPFAELAELSADEIIHIELDDADEEVMGTLLEDTLHRRKLCGEGDLDVPGFISGVRGFGYRGPWGVEIISAEFRKLDPAEQCRRSFETTMHQFELASALDRQTG